jgi:hypothetical protein
MPVVVTFIEEARIIAPYRAQIQAGIDEVLRPRAEPWTVEVSRKTLEFVVSEFSARSTAYYLIVEREGLRLNTRPPVLDSDLYDIDVPQGGTALQEAVRQMMQEIVDWPERYGE